MISISPITPVQRPAREIIGSYSLFELSLTILRQAEGSTPIYVFENGDGTQLLAAAFYIKNNKGNYDLYRYGELSFPNNLTPEENYLYVAMRNKPFGTVEGSLKGAKVYFDELLKTGGYSSAQFFSVPLSPRRPAHPVFKLLVAASPKKQIFVPDRRCPSPQEASPR